MNPATIITRALISVSDKTNLLPLATALQHAGVAIVASGGTAAFLQKNNIATSTVESLTNFPEILGGRVKTLHPHVHGAILARPDNGGDVADLATHQIKKIDLVVVNLYPFGDALKKSLPEDAMIEEIDIGGVALIRAAAKNFSSVGVVTNPDDYNMVIEELNKQQGGKPSLSSATCKNLARIAFRHVAHYDQLIADWFDGHSSETKRGDATAVDATPLYVPTAAVTLRYGENPHQSAAFLSDQQFGLGRMKQWQGKELSYNNYLDLDAALRLLITTAHLQKPTAVIIKHTDPCGVAMADDIVTAFHHAFYADAVSAFGGIIGVNRTVDKKLAEAILHLKIFFEIIIAPEVTDEAKNLLASRKDLRVLSIEPFPTAEQYKKEYRSVMGGILQQDHDNKPILQKNCEVMTDEQPTAQEWQDMLLAMMVAKEMRSNSIAIVASGTTLGLGGGTTSRVMACEKAVGDMLKKNLTGGDVSAGASPLANLLPRSMNPVVASDGFLPFTDNVDIFANGGITAIIQPGGSIKDKEVIAACKARHIKLVFCHSRHFHH